LTEFLVQKYCALWFVFLTIVSFLQPLSFAHAQVFNETQRLDFGLWLVTSNSSNYNITLQANGSYSNSPQLFMLDTPRVGIYQITGLPPFQVIGSVTVVMSQALEFGASQSFTMDNFQTIIPNANGAGETTLRLGARARTSGTGLPYADATYAGILDVTINF
jgi:hypothetical protein